jgi:diguanylate cyclase (GGDEF)-like protein
VLFAFVFVLSNKFMKKLDESQAKLIEMATTDGLTGLYNRKIALMRFEEEISKHVRFKKPLSCLMIDIDHFKSINDTYGHQAGDAFLQLTADILTKCSRKYDTVCRYGGEEFIIILPESDLDTASFVAKKIREKIISAYLPFGEHIIKATISIGAAQMSEDKTETVDEIIWRADNALYAAKQQGRNRVVQG